MKINKGFKLFLIYILLFFITPFFLLLISIFFDSEKFNHLLSTTIAYGITALPFAVIIYFIIKTLRKQKENPKYKTEKTPLINNNTQAKRSIQQESATTKEIKRLLNISIILDTILFCIFYPWLGFATYGLGGNLSLDSKIASYLTIMFFASLILAPIILTILFNYSKKNIINSTKFSTFITTLPLIIFIILIIKTFIYIPD